MGRQTETGEDGERQTVAEMIEWYFDLNRVQRGGVNAAIACVLLGVAWMLGIRL